MKVIKSFSLIELLVVIAIIGVIAAISTPLYKQYQIRAGIAKNIAVLQSLGANLANYYQTHSGSWPTNFTWGNTTITNTGSSTVQTAVTGAGDFTYVQVFFGPGGLWNVSGRLMIIAQLTGSVSGIPGYVAATGGGNYGTHDTIRWVWAEENGVGKNLCGTWGSAVTTDSSTEIPAQYLPTGCRCTQLDQILQTFQPSSVCSY